MNAIDVKSFAQEWRNDIKTRIANYSCAPKLLVISIGVPDDASQVYVNNKLKVASEVGIQAKHIVLGGDYKLSEYCHLVEELSKGHDGVIIQKPAVVADYAFETIAESIPVYADVDCLTDGNAGRLFKGSPLFKPATVEGVIKLLRHECGDLSGVSVAMLGRSNIVGRPMAACLEHEGATVTLYHSKSVGVEVELRRYDVVITATGRANSIHWNMLSAGATVIDVGINRVNGKLCGDFNPEITEGFWAEVYAKNIRYTPVPNGVGLLTTTALMDNVLTAWELQHC